MTKPLLLLMIAAFTLTLPTGASAESGDDTGSDYADADAGSFGIAATSTAPNWCEVDAGSLGVLDPVSTCQG